MTSERFQTLSNLVRHVFKHKDVVSQHALHDLLCEVGYPLFAKAHFTHFIPGSGCDIFQIFRLFDCGGRLPIQQEVEETFKRWEINLNLGNRYP